MYQQETKRLCACGCGEEVRQEKIMGQPLRYKPGHAIRVANQKVAQKERDNIEAVTYTITKLPAGIRLRSKDAIVLALKYTEEQQTKLDEISKSTLGKKKDLLKYYSGVNLCNMCRKVPNYQIRYPNDGVTVIENYCSSCLNNVYFREDADKTNTELAEKYNIQIGKMPPSENEGYISNKKVR